MINSYLAISWALIGLIWVIQLVKYTAFHFVEEGHFKAYHQHHERSITTIVMPLMLAELGLSGWLSWVSNWSLYYLLPLGAVVAIWVSTFLIQIPLHRQLEKGKDEEVINKLVSSNWIRTVLWTAKGIWLLIY